MQADREHAACELARSESRMNDAAAQSVNGRVELWQTITSPSDLAQMFGAQLGANAAMMQDDTAVSRAAALAGSEYAAPATAPQNEIGAPRC